MKVGSLFDGSGGFPLAGALCGFEPVWASEIEPYPIAVTKSRFPNMKHLGDISQINGAEIEPVDIVTFGSPCQDLSVAGKRKGLNHTSLGDEENTRSGLFMEAIRIIKEMRGATNGEYPRYAIWENVPGAFSSNKGEDFRIVLEEFIKVVEPAITMPPIPGGKWPYSDCYVGDGWSIAYRTFDAQYWGVAQRRRRIYLVADFRTECAEEILFERQGLRGDFTQSGTQGQGSAGNAEDSIGTADRELLSVVYGVENRPEDSRVNIDDSGKVQTLTSRMGTGGRNVPLVMEKPVICLQGNGIDRADAAECNGKGWKEDTSYTLNTVDRPAVCYSLDRAAYNQGINAQYDIGIDESGIAHTLVARGPGAVCYWNGEQVCGTLTANNAGGGQRMPDKDNFNCIVEKKPQLASGNAVTGCLMASGYDKLGAQEMFSGDYTVIDAKEPHYIVRRLTPLECCRLQGFPDWWCSNLETENPTESDIEFWKEVFETHRTVISGTSKPKTDKQIIKWLKDPYSDSAIYKMWGNGICLQNALFVMQGIAEELEAENEDQ